jgi:membrane-associated protease RseP (regulator of RpoE activity)
VYSASDYYQPKPMASVDDAIKVFNELQTFYGSGGGFKIQKLMADRTGVRFHESRTVTEQRNEDTVYHDGGLFTEDHTATTTKNVDVAQEHDVWIPADRIAGIITVANNVGLLYSDDTMAGLQTSDHAVGLKLADAFATLQAANYGPNSRYFPDSGMYVRSFADEASQYMAQEYARLGWKQQTGVLVDGVNPGSPAALAGIVTDDIIFEANGKPVAFAYGPMGGLNLGHIVMAELSDKPAAVFDLKIFRGGQFVSARLPLTNPIIGHATELAAAPKPVVESPKPVVVVPVAKPSFGISARDLTTAEAKAKRVHGGVLIATVAEGSAAAALGLQAGDYLLEINGRGLTNLAAVKVLLAAETVTSAVVLRGGKTVNLGSLSSF